VKRILAETAAGIARKFMLEPIADDLDACAALSGVDPLS
jgi:hypothetical protein